MSSPNGTVKIILGILSGIVIAVVAGLTIGFGTHLQAVQVRQGEEIGKVKTEQAVAGQQWKEVEKRLDRIDAKLDKIAEGK